MIGEIDNILFWLTLIMKKTAILMESFAYVYGRLRQ